MTSSSRKCLVFVLLLLLACLYFSDTHSITLKKHLKEPGHDNNGTNVIEFVDNEIKGSNLAISKKHGSGGKLYKSNSDLQKQKYNETMEWVKTMEEMKRQKHMREFQIQVDLYNHFQSVGKSNITNFNITSAELDAIHKKSSACLARTSKKTKQCQKDDMESSSQKCHMVLPLCLPDEKVNITNTMFYFDVTGFLNKPPNSRKHEINSVYLYLKRKRSEALNEDRKRKRRRHSHTINSPLYLLIEGVNGQGKGLDVNVAELKIEKIRWDRHSWFKLSLKKELRNWKKSSRNHKAVVVSVIDGDKKVVDPTLNFYGNRCHRQNESKITPRIFSFPYLEVVTTSTTTGIILLAKTVHEREQLAHSPHLPPKETMSFTHHKSIIEPAL